MGLNDRIGMIFNGALGRTHYTAHIIQLFLDTSAEWSAYMNTPADERNPSKVIQECLFICVGMVEAFGTGKSPEWLEEQYREWIKKRSTSAGSNEIVDPVLGFK